MRSFRWLLFASLALGGACSKETPVEESPASTVRQEIEATISEIEAKARTKGKALGMAQANSADIDAVRAYICGALVNELQAKKKGDVRDEVAADLGIYACRERDEWLAVLRKTAADQGMRGAADASLNEARDFVCDRIKESLRAVRPADRPSLQIEGRVYDCIF